MVDRARVRLIRGSQGAELRETFRQLAEIDGPDGPKFARRHLLELAARIVGRTYEPMLFELCHLTRAALLAGGGAPGGRNGGFEWLFWGIGEARPAAFRSAFLNAPCFRGTVPPPCADRGRYCMQGALLVADRSVELVYSDGRFEVRYGRMPELAAMMELLVSALGYAALVSALDPLAAPSLQRAEVSGASRDLARRLYAWLGDRLPAAQAQRKFHAMVAFLETDRGQEFSEEDIDDDAVLRFWRRHAAEDGTADFRGYRNTFLAFLALLRVLRDGAEIGRLERSRPIGTDYAAGELEPADDAPIAALAPEDDPLALLQEEPAAAVKALNRRELALLRLPVGESEAVRRLPRSWLRAECFGPVQNRLSQALRRKAGAAELAAILASGPDLGYRARIEALEKARDHVGRTMKACLYVLHRLANGAGDGDREGSDGPPPALDVQLLDEARRAFESLNRAGFERTAPQDVRLAPAYRALGDALPAVSDRLGSLLRALGPPAAWEAAEVGDRPIFADMFARLYGIGRPGPLHPADDERTARGGRARTAEPPGNRRSGLRRGRGDRAPSTGAKP